MPITRESIEACHAAYCRATKYQLPLSIDREMAWVEWLRRGLTAEDVAVLVHHHQSLARRGEMGARSLKFRSLIVSADWAEEDLAAIRAQARGPARQPNRESVLRATGRGPAETIPPAGQTAAPAREVVEEMLAKLRRAAQGDHENEEQTSRS